MPGADRRLAMEALVPGIVIDADDVEKDGVAAELRPQPAAEEIEGLILRLVPAERFG
jgi:hypothetical protein